MNLVFFYRPKMKGAHSIEEVFELIKSGLPADVKYQDYICTSKWKRFNSFFKASAHQGEVNHITGDIHTIALFLKKSKTILTVHDVGRYERDLTGLKKIIVKLIWLTLPLKRAGVITTISEFTKQKLIDLFNVPESKITVIPNPAPDDFAYNYKEFDAEVPVILQIGSGANKNVYRLIEAIKNTTFRLLLIRKPDAKVKQLLEDYKIQYEWHTDITREQVYDCYKKCDILFFASEYEGFGVPILEANIIGRPVVTSNISSMPEVAQNSAILINPFNVDEIKAALLRIREDEVLRNKLIANGLKNIERFSKKHIAMQYYNVYDGIMKNKKK